MGLLNKLRGKKQQVTSQASGPVTEAGIQEWLVTHIAAVTQIAPEDVDIERPFAEFGMDSMQLFQLSGDLQKFLGREVSEIVAWDFPTIAQLSRHLSAGPEVVNSSEPLPVDGWAATEPQP